MKTRQARSFTTIVALGGMLAGVMTGPAAAFESGRADFELIVNDDLILPYRVFAIYVLPSERLRFEAEAADVSAESGTLIAVAPDSWDWIAPREPGASTLTFAGTRDQIRINVFVMHPAETLDDGSLNGYSIGTYSPPLRGDPAYNRPEGFIELNESTAEIELSPHFRLNQFPSKQPGDLPKYLTLREHLFLKLELLLEHVNHEGIETDSFTVMSGFRTPVYNRAIGNGQHSRHVYGGAADIYIDVAPRDGIMDDLNRDGLYNFRDAQFLYRLADRLFARAENADLRGGLGVYRSTSAHGPFLHVDARGFRARWGLIP